MKLNICVIIFLLTSSACKKSSFLNGKPDQRLIVPETVKELQTLLDNINVINGTGQGLVPVLGEIGSDNYYAFKFPTSSSGPVLKSLYIWNHKINAPNTTRLYDWDYPYRCIFYCNVVLEELDKIEARASEVEDYGNVKGSALFHRAHMFYQLAQIFASTYNKSTSKADLGIPLKLSADIDEQPSRSSLSDTYDQILNDLKKSVPLLPVTPKYKTRPSKPASLALIARTYQAMQEYDSAWYYADRCLQLYNELIDYNDNSVVNTSGSQGIRVRYNSEVIFHAKIIQTNVSNFMYSPPSIRVDTNLYTSYSDNDLRKVVFFSNANPGNNFKGSYDASTTALFGGIATDEVYLIRAESFARKGQTEEAMNDLNMLLIKRWKYGTFFPFSASSSEQALNLILTERRKELIFRGLRWTDVRRLNQDGANITLTRVIDGEAHSLTPNDKRFTYLIPEDVMNFNPDWQQNHR